MAKDPTQVSPATKWRIPDCVCGVNPFYTVSSQWFQWDEDYYAWGVRLNAVHMRLDRLVTLEYCRMDDDDF